MKRYLRKGSSIFIAFVMILSQLIALPQVVFASEPWGSFGIDYIISTVAGNQNDHSGNTTDGISARADALSYPQGIALDSRGNMYFAEPGKNKIYKVDSATGMVVTFAGNGTAGYTGDGGAATSAELSYPTSIAFDKNDNMYIADNENKVIRKVDTRGNISTIVDQSQGLVWPNGIAVDGSGNIYISGSNNVIYKANSNGVIVTSAAGLYGGSVYGIAVDNSGNAYVGDTTYNEVYKIHYDSTGGVTKSVIAGTGTPGYSGDGSSATSAEIDCPTGVAVDDRGNVYILDTVNYRIRVVDTSGNIYTIAGTGTSGDTGDGGAALSAQIAVSSYGGITVDSNGNVYFSDDSNNVIRKLDAQEHFVTYNSNGADTGTAPTDNNAYSSGSIVTVKDNTGVMARTGYVFSGWNTKADGSGSMYWPNISSYNTYTMRMENMTLYAIWAQQANAAHNVVSLNSNSITTGNSVTITAVGDRQSATGSLVGEEGYIPTTWTSTETGKSGTFTLNGSSYTSNYTSSTAGSYTITASYRLQYWDGTQWIDYESVDTKTTSLTVNAPTPTPTTASRGNDSVSVDPSSITVGSSATITAVGDRQLANGSVNGDERYSPTTWTSTETGKSGTFTLKSGNYTSNYTPSTAGSYIITASYKLQVWNGTSWIDAEGSDTKTAILTVKVPAPTPTTANRGNDSVSVNSSSITVGSSANITAVGDRQLANGSVNGDERYIPTTWTSSETGKLGTFTLNGSDYTSNYTPSTAGSYTITASYKLQVWNGTSWVDAEGSDTKTAALTVTSETSINGKVEDGKTGTEVAPINAKVITESDGTKTIIMKESESILVKKPDGTTTALGNISEVSVLADDGSVVPITSDGTITFSNMTNGSESNFKVYYDLGNGEKIVIGKVKVSISAIGDVNVVSQLIDPYGTIRDSVTGNKISGVNVKLYYANTARNIANGKTPDTLVQLPMIDGFKPNNNQDPQISDLLGTYGWMVYPDADYYIVATKDGYDKYTSPTISVGKEIVKYDFKMNPTTNITKLPQTGSPIDISILIFAGVVLIIAGLMVGRRKKINKN